MEGSTKSKNVNNYEILSKYYDELLQDKDALSLWLQYIEEEPFKSVLELASGSGVMAGILKEKGYDVLASDISESMKNASVDNFDGEYIILNMIEYSLNKKFDLIICICDSLNYLEYNELDKFFKCAYNHLNDNGRLIFDMHSLELIQEYKDEYIEEGYIKGVPYQWTIMSDSYDNLINEHFTFYTNDVMIQEHHTQNVFSISDVSKIMYNYFNVKIIEDFVENEKILIIGRKK